MTDAAAGVHRGTGRSGVAGGGAGAAAGDSGDRAPQPQSAEDDYENRTVPFLQGLKETGYVEGQNVAAEYR